jgi:acetyl-CoA carboxylase biotin carboxyl carrier protein
MTVRDDPVTSPSLPDASEPRFEAVAAQARELAKRLEGTSVQRVVIEADGCRVEIERGAPAAPAVASSGWEYTVPSHPIATGAGPGLGVAPGARGASGSFAALPDVDRRIPVLAPLVGTFYRSPRPGAKAFVEVGDIVEMGQAVCIVEAMKMMNQVGAGEPGQIVEIVAVDGEAVEFEQVLMYMEPVGD